MSARPHIVLIGCGKMGASLLRGWLDHNIDAEFSVIEPHDIDIPGVQHFKSINDAAKSLQTASTIILAVKPQAMLNVCNELEPHIAPDTTILSIAAGQSLNSFADYFGSTQPVIRTMPNTPAAIGKGMSVAVANAHVTDEAKVLVTTLLKTAGKLEWTDDESLLDAVTALSGSGPAYVFYLIEMLEKAGIESGLPAEMAVALARQTVIGAAALAETDHETPPATLRENVTSPGGTTAAALKILMDGRAQNLFTEALQAATARSRELNS
ncbi:MAG: pyrroline-5-carboxylate reductase [Rhodospirillales bacterium]|nr:pyrroline-5-carboxylate reductase [Rhodospirillales bacterium]